MFKEFLFQFERAKKFFNKKYIDLSRQNLVSRPLEI